jgi:hypothetical protein
MKVFVAGEGSDEIGDWAKDRAYLPETPAGGVVEALLRKVRAEGWRIVGGCPWRRIRKYKVRRGLHDFEKRNVLGVCDMAAEAECNRVVFVRDRDGEAERERAIDAAIEQARELGLIDGIAGGVAIEATDAWILALLGESRSERLTDPKRRLREKHGIDDGSRKAEVVTRSDLNAVPADARSLRRWVGRADAVLRDEPAPE